MILEFSKGDVAVLPGKKAELCLEFSYRKNSNRASLNDSPAQIT